MELLHRRLVQFLAVAETGNIHRAAGQLCMAQPALSRAMKLLEEEMAVPLLIRQPRGVLLTAAGDSLVESTRQALAILEQGVILSRENANQAKGRLTIGYGIFSSMGCMPNLIVDFRKKHPNIDVQLNLLASIDQLQALNKGDIDIGFAFSIACKAPLSAWRFSKEQPVILLNKEHPWADREQINIEALQNEPMVLGNIQRWGYHRDIVNAICLSAGFLPTVAAEADHLPDFISHLRMGEGVGMMGEAIIDQIPASLRVIRLAKPTLTFDQSMVWNSSRIKPTSQLFIDYVKQNSILL
jgi:DNA-binding transcriptional LysR family regulator